MEKEINKLVLFKIIRNFIATGLLLIIFLVTFILGIFRFDTSYIIISIIILPFVLIVFLFSLIQYIRESKNYSEDKIDKLKNLKKLISKLFVVIIAFGTGISYGFLNLNNNISFNFMIKILYIFGGIILILIIIFIIITIKALINLKYH